MSGRLFLLYSKLALTYANVGVCCMCGALLSASFADGVSTASRLVGLLTYTLLAILR